MPIQRRYFETRGPVSKDRNYVVPRTDEIADLVERIKRGRYIVIFAPRQTGKTTFFRWTLETLTAEDETFFPIQLDFEIYRNASIEAFYTDLRRKIHKEIVWEFQRHQSAIDSEFQQFLENYPLKDHFSFQPFLEELASHLGNRKVIIIIDEFDGIPQAAMSDFLYTLRGIYLSRDPNRCPYSVGIVGVKNITQLNYDRSISPFNIQDEFSLKNFTLDQVRELLGQYTDEVGQAYAPEVIESIHQQTAGQPFLVNRIAQILTEEMKIPLDETITLEHFEIAHRQILDERNVHISHLTTNIRRDARFERILMGICLKEKGVPFNLHNEFISELVIYGILKRGIDGFCEIQNPIYQYHIVQAFQPLFNGLEDEYLPEDTDAGFLDYLTSDGNIDMRALLSNFRDFIARAGYRILEVPEKPQEFIGQYLLFAYLDQFVRQVRGFMYVEVRTGRGQMDLIILHRGDKYIVETKIWGGKSLYQAGKNQLAAYLNLEGAKEGYYIVFDHRQKPQALVEEEILNGKAIVSYCIPVVQRRPSTNSMFQICSKIS
ncbi:ATP-binding protein [Candidatus Poribacteria bacterium]|nr:ATP-binding protein [Candidatus Poribacteria bacterium]